MNNRLFDFIEKSPTAFHTVENIIHTLVEKGFISLQEGSVWNLERGKGYFVTRNDSSVIAFRIPQEKPQSFMIAASHSDSPCFKLKENSIFSANGYTKFSCEKYGGMINSTWLDRPLSVAGRVVYRDNDTIKSTLIDMVQCVAIIPNVAIHLNRKANEESALNASTDLVPVFSSVDSTDSFKSRIASLAGVNPEDILSSDLFLYNMDKGVCWEDFISAPRLDDLQCVFATLEAFVSSAVTKSIPVLAVFDNEEVGSSTKQGADSDFLQSILNKVSVSLDADILSESFMLSCDNGHAIHPNHPELTDNNNCVRMNGGVVIKYNANQRYCTDAISSSLVKVLCDRAEVPFQAYANRSDISGGSTLGNIANTHASMITADIGLAQLAMHSAFETAGRDDTEYLYKLLLEFFSSSLSRVDDSTYKIF